MTDKELKRSVLTVTAFASFLTPFMGSSVNLALPSIGDEFGVNAVTLNWIVSSYMLSTSILLLPAGRVGDILGRKKIFTAGLVIFTLTMILLTFTPNITWLIGARVLQGLGSAMLFGTNLAILTSVFPPGERGRAMGINVTAVYIGLASGPFLGGLSNPVSRMEKHLCLPGADGHNKPHSDPHENERRMGRGQRRKL